jgi:ubiquinone/menaquinone biosynthesis C-methylase UbiE
MRNDAEERASKFYNTVGWATEDGVTEDARRWEDLREHASEYVSKCRRRVLAHIPGNGVNMLDMASGPIQYVEYLEYSRNFKKRYCVDLSSAALESARKKIGDHGEYLLGSFFDIPLEENFFDCTLSLHTIFHIDKDRQEEAVRKLIRVTKPGKPVIIVYGNPNTIISSLPSPVRFLKKVKRFLIKPVKTAPKAENLGLYFHLYPLEWWHRFDDMAIVKIFPWRSFASEDQKKLFPDNILGKKMFDILFALEQRYPDFFVRHFQYPMIILTKI